MTSRPPTAPCGQPGADSSLHSPPLGAPPAPAKADAAPGQSRRGAAVPMTDGTPAPSRQKNAAAFLAGRSPGVMDFYAPGLFADQKPDTRDPAPDDPSAVRSLVHWREDAPYG